MKISIICLCLLLVPQFLYAQMEISTANKKSNNLEYFKSAIQNKENTLSHMTDSVDASILMHTRYLDQEGKQKFLVRYNQINNTNLNLYDLTRLSDLYADRKQMQFDRTSKDSVVDYQFGTTDERKQLLDEQMDRQKKTQQRATEFENEGREFIKGLTKRN